MIPTIWVTSHGINQRVTESMHKGLHFPRRSTTLVEAQPQPSIALSYGILRGSDQAYQRAAEHKLDWWELDNGYFKRGHFNGYYRVSRNGLSAAYDENLANSLSLDRWEKLGIDFSPWQKNDNGHILVCPPTAPISNFYNITTPTSWENDTIDLLSQVTNRAVKVRRKEETTIPLTEDLENCWCVVSFNSMVMIDALLMGIPAISAPVFPIYGWNNLNVVNVESPLLRSFDRLKLFQFLAYHQFTLEELEKEETWKLIFKLQGSCETIPNFYEKVA